MYPNIFSTNYVLLKWSGESKQIERKQRIIRGREEGRSCCQCPKGGPVSARAHDAPEPCRHECAHAEGESPAAIKVRCTHWFVP